MTDTKDSEKENLNKPQPSPLDFMKMLGAEGGAELDKTILAAQVDAALDRSLKMLQIMYYSHEMLPTKDANAILKHYKSALELIGENLDKAVEEYQSRHGEI